MSSTRDFLARRRWPLPGALAIAGGLALWLQSADRAPEQEAAESENRDLSLAELPAAKMLAEAGSMEGGQEFMDARDEGGGTENSAARDGVDVEQVQISRDRAFISYMFPLLSTWNSSRIRPLLSAETTRGNSDDDLDEVMEVLASRLGELQYFETPRPATAGITGLAEPEAEPQAGIKSGMKNADLQHYQFTAWFESGPAEVNLVLHQQQQESSLYSFNIQVSN